MTNADKDGNPS